MYIFICRKSDIAFIIKPNSQWIPSLDEYPLSDIKLFNLNFTDFEVLNQKHHPSKICRKA